MKKINSLVLSTLTAALLVGCGGGSSSSSTSTTSVPVTKGPLLMATAVDSGSPAKEGTQIPGTNKYEFEGEITYPIVVTGGYVDVNNNGVIDAGDYEFNGKLSSYSKVVTPITTYLGDTSSEDGKAKLEALKTLTGASDEDLTELDPAEVEGTEVLALNAAVYQTYAPLMDNDDSNDDEEIDDSSFETEYEDYKEAATGAESQDDILAAIEEKLKTDSGVEELNELDAQKVNFSKDDLEGNKLTVGSETYYFREGDVVLGDSGEDYTEIMSYGSIEDGIIKLEFEDGYYDILELTETGFDVSYYDKNETLLEPTLSVSSELTEYTEAELTEVLADVPFELTEDMISDKTITISDEIGTVEASFESNGTYSEVFDDSISNGGTGTCSGTWEIDSVHTNTINVTSTCSDNNTEESFTLTFNEEPAVGSTFSYVDSEESGTETIDAISDISSSDDSTNNSGTTNSLVSGKSIIAYDEYGYVQASFYADGTYKEVGPDEDENGNLLGMVYTCSGKWLDFGNNKIAMTCDDNGTNALPTGTAGGSNDEVVITLPSSLIVGSTMSAQDDTETFSLNVANISDLSNTGTTNSILSGKYLEVSDSYGDVMAIFQADGTYREYGTDYPGTVNEESWSCTGKWLDFGNNKIGITCNDDNTMPDGIVDDNEVLILLEDDTPTIGEKIYAVDFEEIFETTITTSLTDYMVQ